MNKTNVCIIKVHTFCKPFVKQLLYKVFLLQKQTTLIYYNVRCYCVLFCNAVKLHTYEMKHFDFLILRFFTLSCNKHYKNCCAV